jgi:PHD/YefM family antitoxin component YafN of YafNO toxin-antitoxin module
MVMKLKFKSPQFQVAAVNAIIDTDDYDNDTDYLNAIPGMAEKLIEGMNTPLSECEDWD